jgi:hypothetical protein
MDLDFKADGTVETLNIKANVNFLNNLGELKTFGTSKVSVLNLTENLTDDAFVHVIYDSEGHSCQLCYKNCNYFIEQNHTLDGYLIICNAYIEKMHNAFKYVKETTLS